MKKQNWNKILLLDGLFEGGRMLVGAISVVYLLAHGQTLAFVATLKLIQSVTLILSEVPTGIYCDLHGHKKGLLAALLCGVVGFFCYAIHFNTLTFVFGEVGLALALSFWSGAYESFAIDQMELKEREIDQFFHTNGTINRFSVMLFGFFGGLIASYSNELSYWAALVIFVLAFTHLKLRLHETQVEHQIAARKGLKESCLEAVKILNQKKELRPYIILTIALQFLLVPMLHYWQPLFESMAGPAKGGSLLGLVFMSYVATTACVGMVFSKYAKTDFMQTEGMKIAVVIVAVASHVLVAFCHSFWALLAAFCLLQAAIAMGRTMMSAAMNKIIESKYRASMLSSVSLIGRFGGVFSLALVSLSFTKLDGVQSLFLINSIFMALSATVIIYKLIQTSLQKIVVNYAN